MRYRLAAITAALCLFASPVLAVTWSSMSPLKIACENYCPVIERSGILYAANNKSGDVAIFKNSGGVTSSFSRIATISQSKMRSWGVKNTKGLTVDWARTVGLAEKSGVIHALFHLGTGYPTNGGYIPVYTKSSDGGKTWSTGKAVKVGGSVKYIFSSSMAYQIVNGVHYMVQDAGAYGYGALVMFRSSDGVNYTKLSGNIAALTGDSAPAWPSLAYYGGRFHLVYTSKWDNSAIRHVSSADGKSWRVEKKTAAYAFKGCNIFESKSNLYCHSRPAAKLWAISGVGGSSGGDSGSTGDSGGSASSGGSGACEGVSVSTGSGSITAKWNHGTCEFKLKKNSSSIYYKKLTGTTHTKSGLANGTYDVGIRNPATGKAIWNTVNVGSSTGDACKDMSVSVSGNTVTARFNSGTCEVKAKNSSGKTVYYKKLTGSSHSFSLSSGTYTIIVRQPSDGSTVSKKVTIS